MTDPLRPLNLAALLATVAAVCQVCSGIPGPLPQPTGGPFVFPEVNPLGGALPSGDAPANTGARLTYDVISITGLGYDEFRRTWAADGVPATASTDGDDFPAAGAITETVSGNREVVVQVRCEMPAPGLGAVNAAAAFAPLERVRTRMYLDSIGNVLEAAGFAIQTIGPSRPADFDNGGLLCRAAYLEIIFNAADVASDDAVTTIETLDAPTQVDPEDV